MENAGIFFGHLECFTVIWHIVLPFGNVVVIWYIFPRFGILCQEKSDNTGLNTHYLISHSDFLNVWLNRRANGCSCFFF
jgi:hypothetical protein